MVTLLLWKPCLPPQLLSWIYELVIPLKGLTLSMVSPKLESSDLFNIALRTSLKCYFCPYLEQTLIELGK